MSPLSKLAREPLVHFVCAGALLFGVYAWLHPERLAGEDPQRIELTPDDLRQIQLAWLAQGRPAPTPEQMQSLVEGRIREEILYREALALGLDQGDTIVKRRLAQKMEFLFEDVSALREPGAGELEAFYAENAASFTEPARATFRQLYFSPDKRGAQAREDAARVLEKLAGQPVEAPLAAQLADPFMFQDYYGDRSFDEVASALGPGFARALFELAPGAWTGPIESGYGWHLVWIDSITPARVPALEDVASDVRREWVEKQRAEIRERALEAMRRRYEVVVPEDFEPADLASLEGAARERPEGPP